MKYDRSAFEAFGFSVQELDGEVRVSDANSVDPVSIAVRPDGEMDLLPERCAGHRYVQNALTGKPQAPDTLNPNYKPSVYG